MLKTPEYVLVRMRQNIRRVVMFLKGKVDQTRFHLQIVLSSRINIEKSMAYKFLIPWLGTGLLISDGELVLVQIPQV